VYVILIGLIHIIYGLLCRVLNLYFFWESSFIGWLILFLGIISLLIARVKSKKTHWKNNILEIFAIVLLILITLIQVAILFVFPKTNPYQTAEEFLIRDSNIAAQIGTVKNISIKPVGLIEWTIAPEERIGRAEFKLILKGTKKYKDVKIYLSKEANQNWKVQKIE